MSDKNFEETVVGAQTLRALMLVVDSWENDKDLTIEQMTKHLEALNDVVTGEADFQTFTESANLIGRERLN